MQVFWVGVGPFPVRLNPSRALELVEGEAAVRRSIDVILGTAKGERLMRPDFGCGIHDLVFQANTHQFRSQVEHQVREALEYWEQRIDVLEVRAETAPEEPTLLLIRIDYRIRNSNTPFNLVYPFYINEGND